MAGIPGSGKTTLIAPLAERLQARVFHVDAYFWDRRGGKPVMLRQLDGSSGVVRNHPGSFDTHGLAADLRESIGADEWTILDGHFALALEPVEPLIDHRIWIETPRDVASARKILRQHHEGGRTLETAGRGYVNNVLPAIDKYLAPSAARADIVLDGSLGTEQLVALTLSHLGLSTP